MIISVKLGEDATYETQSFVQTAGELWQIKRNGSEQGELIIVLETADS